jgi:hypothetical protein
MGHLKVLLRIAEYCAELVKIPAEDIHFKLSEDSGLGFS